MLMTHPTKRRGRPRKAPVSQEDTRLLLLRNGLELLTEQGYVATGLDKILKKAGVPKGSFYYYFSSKEVFGKAVLDSYGDYFLNRLRKSLGRNDLQPLARLDDFVATAEQGMQKHDFRRGCLVGNLAQEITVLPDSFRDQLNQILLSWEALIAQCLEEAKLSGELPNDIDSVSMAHFFWIGWEGAVMRSRLIRSSSPMAEFHRGFVALIKR